MIPPEVRALAEALRTALGVAQPDQAVVAAHRINAELSAKGYEITSIMKRAGMSPQQQGALEIHEGFQALIDKGFSREEAFTLIQTMFANQAGRQGYGG